jgi:hypothetical protein
MLGIVSEAVGSCWNRAYAKSDRESSWRPDHTGASTVLIQEADEQVACPRTLHAATHPRSRAFIGVFGLGDMWNVQESPVGGKT